MFWKSTRYCQSNLSLCSWSFWAVNFCCFCFGFFKKVVLVKGCNCGSPLYRAMRFFSICQPYWKIVSDWPKMIFFDIFSKLKSWGANIVLSQTKYSQNAAKGMIHPYSTWMQFRFSGHSTSPSATNRAPDLLHMHKWLSLALQLDLSHTVEPTFTLNNFYNFVGQWAPGTNWDQTWTGEIILGGSEP